MSIFAKSLSECPCFRPEKGKYKCIISLVNPISDKTSYSLFIQVLTAGESIAAHEHSIEEQVFYILRGAARVQIGEDFFNYKAGDHVRVPPGIKHGIYNDSDDRLYLYVLTIPDHEFSEWLYQCEPIRPDKKDLLFLSSLDFGH